MKIKFFPYQAHCFAYGGFENLMNSTYDALYSYNVPVSKIDVWSRDDDFDIAHFWGLGFPNYANIKWAKKQGKKVVITAILPNFQTRSQIFRYYISTILGRRYFENEVLSLTDILVVTTERSRFVAVKYFNFQSNKVRVIPNILLKSYFEMSGRIQEPKIKLVNYVFSIGNVCKRKNQLRLALACLEIKVNLVIVGPVLIGEEQYGYELEALIRKSANIIWLNSMKRDSFELISAYKNCLLYALPSLEEEQPTSAQEAGLLGKPLLLGNLPYAHQEFFKNACLVNPISVKSIADGLKKVITNPGLFTPCVEVFDRCREENVVKSYQDVYLA